MEEEEAEEEVVGLEQDQQLQLEAGSSLQAASGSHSLAVGLRTRMMPDPGGAEAG